MSGGDAPQLGTATTQDLLDPVPGLSVWHGKRVSTRPHLVATSRYPQQIALLAAMEDVPPSVAMI